MKYETHNRAWLKGVHPFVVSATLDAIEATEAEFPGYSGRITAGKRTDAEQFINWLKGRDPNTEKIISKKDVVTYARTSDESPHGPGLASDTEWLTPAGDVAPKGAPIWKAYARNVASAGLKSGADFSNLTDYPHAELHDWENHRDWMLKLEHPDAATATTDGTGSVMWFVGGLLATGVAIAYVKGKK